MADLSPANYPALKNELATDPKGLGYAALLEAEPPNDRALAALLNSVGASNERVPGPNLVDAWQVFHAIDPDEWPGIEQALAAANMSSWFHTLMQASRVELLHPNMQKAFGALNPDGTFPNTRAGLLSLVLRPASRAEALFGSGVELQPWDVARARQLEG